MTDRIRALFEQLGPDELARYDAAVKAGYARLIERCEPVVERAMPRKVGRLTAEAEARYLGLLYLESRDWGLS